MWPHESYKHHITVSRKLPAVLLGTSVEKE